MKVGIALNMLQKPGLSDAAVFAEHMALGDLAEPLGFDSLFASSTTSPATPCRRPRPSS